MPIIHRDTDKPYLDLVGTTTQPLIRLRAEGGGNPISLVANDGTETAFTSGGSMWHFGNGAPSQVFMDGDIYQDKLTDEIWKQVSGSWIDQGFSIRGSAGTNGPAGSGAAALSDAQLSVGVAAAVTSLTLDRSATGAIKAQGWIVLDAYTNQAEVCKVNSVSGTTVNLISATKYAHSANAYILYAHGGRIPASYWAPVGDNTTDDSIPLQEAIDQCGKNANGFWLDLESKSYVVSQPLALPSGCKIRQGQLTMKSTWGPVQPETAMLVNMQSGFPVAFTADTVGDTISVGTNNGLNGAGSQIMVKGTALPAPLVTGGVYYAVNTTTTTTQLATTSGGTPIDITTAGSGGFAYQNIAQLDKVYIESLYCKMNSTVAGATGARLNLQQNSWTKDFRIDTPSSTSTCLNLSGQISNHYAMEMNGLTPGDGSTMLQVAGSGHNFFGINLTDCSTGIHVVTGTGNGVDNITFHGLWTENISNHVVFDNGAQGVSFDSWLSSLGTNQVALTINSSNTSYHIGTWRGNNGTKTFINDTVRGFTILDGDLPQGAVAGFSQLSGLVAPSMGFLTSTQTGAYTAKMVDGVILGNAATAPFTITLPTPAGIAGKKYTIKKIDSTGNSVTVGTVAGLIDGASVYSLTSQYMRVTVVSDGVNWNIV